MEYWAAFRDGFVQELARENAERTVIMRMVNPFTKEQLLQRRRDELCQIVFCIVFVVLFVSVLVGLIVTY